MNVSQFAELFSPPVAVKVLSKKVIETLFRPGRSLRGIVTRDLGDGKFVFRVAKYNLVATSVKPLLVGQQVKVLVKQNKPKLFLQIKSDDEEFTVEKPAIEKMRKQEKTEVPCIYLKCTEGEAIEEARIFDAKLPLSREAAAGAAFVLSMFTGETGNSTYQFCQTDEALNIDIITGNYRWFQKIRSSLPELQRLLKRQTAKRVFINVRLQKEGNTAKSVPTSGSLNYKI